MAKMMKKLYTLYILICLGFTMQAQIFHETFDSTTAPAGWTMTNTTNCNWQFGFTGNMPGSGYFTPASFTSGAAAFIDDYCSDNNYTVELVSPITDLGQENVTSAQIEVIYNHQTFSNDGNFYIKLWNGSSWVTVLTVDGDMPASDTGNNATAIIDITPYLNNAFRVKFEYTDQNSLTWGVGIDDFKIVNTATVGIEDLLPAGFRYYPNPVVNDILTLKANEDISEVLIYNSIGQQILAKQPMDNEYKVKMDGLPSGMYLAHVVIGTKKGSFKIIKQ
jgi:hypothetical protein